MDTRLGKATWWTIAGIAAALIALVVLAVATLGGGDPPAAPNAAAATTATTATTAASATPVTAASETPNASRSTGPSSGPLDDLCAKVDFGPVGELGAAATQPATGDHSEKSDYTAYTCDRLFSGAGLQISADVTTLVGGDAGKRFADARTNAPPGAADVGGVGSGAFGYQIGDGAVRTYQLWALDGHTQLGVRLKVTSAAAGSPSTDRLRDAAAAVARAAIARLHA